MPTNTAYRHNHYVPVWYQKRFMRPGQGVYHYLDLKPGVVVSDGHRFTRRALRPLGPVLCFAQDDLYTTKWGSVENTEIEQFVFGKVDTEGRKGVEYFGNLQHPDDDFDEAGFMDLVTYMSVQKLRTPKGLGWLAQTARFEHQNLTLLFLQNIQGIFGAIWTECVWQIADASQSAVKFIISDHPVTVYNRGCFPGSSFFASSKESVGDIGFRQFPKCMVQGDFRDMEGAEPIGFSHGQFGLVVEPLDDAAGELLPGAEVVQDQRTVRA
jgi:hypothetical protein